MSGSYGGGRVISEGDFGPFGSAFSRQPEQKTVFFGERWEVLVHRKIGDGGFGQVYRGNDRAWNPPVETACKRVVLANDLQRAAFETEVKILKKVHDHNFIITLYGEAIVDRDAWMFLELATGGELFDRLVDCGSLTERARPPACATRRVPLFCLLQHFLNPVYLSDAQGPRGRTSRLYYKLSITSIVAAWFTATSSSRTYARAQSRLSPTHLL